VGDNGQSCYGNNRATCSAHMQHTTPCDRQAVTVAQGHRLFVWKPGRWIIASSITLHFIARLWLGTQSTKDKPRHARDVGVSAPVNTQILQQKAEQNLIMVGLLDGMTLKRLFSIGF
jgi:hypothetical protein